MGKMIVRLSVWEFPTYNDTLSIYRDTDIGKTQYTETNKVIEMIDEMINWREQTWMKEKKKTSTDISFTMTKQEVEKIVCYNSDVRIEQYHD